ncbi:hypothetical protein LZ32DRAFT_659970 [Colletotrichum eremochloae]|nr:hypothetical protein LZ32DRAFT_659970 [Colletotrichum eremochloae]
MSPPLALFLLIFSLFSRAYGDRTAESVCCGQGYACLSNGMCQATGKELQKGGATELVRGACTDRSWRSSSCPLFCINPETDNVAGGIGVAKFQGTVEELYYCINTVQDRVNCTAKQNVLFFQESPTAITTIGVAATTVPASSSTTSESATASLAITSQTSSIQSSAPNTNTVPLSSATNCPESSSASGSTNQNVTIGAAVGASVGGLSLGILGTYLFVCLRRRRRRARAESITTHPPVQYYAPGPPTDRYVSPPPHNNQVYEAPSKWEPPIAQDRYGPQELPGWQPEPRRG